jgi:hypothetical protein
MGGRHETTKGKLGHYQFGCPRLLALVRHGAAVAQATHGRLCRRRLAGHHAIDPGEAHLVRARILAPKIASGQRQTSGSLPKSSSEARDPGPVAVSFGASTQTSRQLR